MIDVASAQGIEIDTRALQDSLEIPVIPMVAKRNSGIKELVNQIAAIASCEYKYNPDLPEVSADHLQIYQDILKHVRPYIQEPYTPEWIAVKLMEGDPEVSKMVEDNAQKSARDKIEKLLIKHEDALHAVVNGRYDWIEKITRAVVSRFKMGQVVLTDRIDHILTRPIFGIPVLLAVMAFVFFLTYAVGVPMQGWLSDQIQHFIKFCEPFTTGWPDWLRRLIAQRCHRRSRFRAHFSAGPADLFRHHGASGRCRLHGARGFCHGQNNASCRSAREKFYSHVSGIRL